MYPTCVSIFFSYHSEIARHCMIDTSFKKKTVNIASSGFFNTNKISGNDILKKDYF